MTEASWSVEQRREERERRRREPKGRRRGNGRAQARITWSGTMARVFRNLYVILLAGVVNVPWALAGYERCYALDDFDARIACLRTAYNFQAVEMGMAVFFGLVLLTALLFPVIGALIGAHKH